VIITSNEEIDAQVYKGKWKLGGNSRITINHLILKFPLVFDLSIVKEFGPEIII
jgi:hypothetical protein